MKNNQKFLSLLAKLLNISVSKINISSSVNNLDEYDSLAVLNIATYFEKKTKNLKIKYDVKDFSSVKNIIKFIEKNKIKIWILR